MRHGPLHGPVCLLVVSLVLCVTCVRVTCVETRSDDQGEGQFLDEFAVSVKRGGRAVAEAIARDHGFVIQRELPNAGLYILEHASTKQRSRRSAVRKVEDLLRDERVEHAQQEEVLQRGKRYYVPQSEIVAQFDQEKDMYLKQREEAKDAYSGQRMNDPFFKVMWYIRNTGQVGGEIDMDMNIEPVWDKGFTGKGITVTVLDDGIDHRHPDLIGNYDPKASTDLNDKNDTDHDPLPNIHDIENRHGTRCAGQIAAAANNSVCGVGIAYNANIGGIRILDGRVTDSLETEALLFNNNYVDIFSASWGPLDNGKAMDGPRKFSRKAFRKGVTEGRNGKGCIYVWAAGNGGQLQDDCGADGYLGMPETLSIGAVNNWGRSPFFVEKCSSTLAVVPSGGDNHRYQYEGNINNIRTVTTDMNFGCIDNFQGTSSAAPLAAGCIANVLQANPDLGWRDVQHIIVHSTRVPSVDDSWIINGAGHHVSPRFGFGLMDCSKMVELAQGWNNFPDQHLCLQTNTVNKTIEQNGAVVESMTSEGCKGNSSTSVDRLEHVRVMVDMDTERRGETLITLTSPSGTKSQLLGPRRRDKKKGPWHFIFMTVFSWDENPIGTWTLEVQHVPTPGESGEIPDATKPFGLLKEWTLVLYGTDGTRGGGRHIEPQSLTRAYSPTEEQVLAIKRKEVELSKRVLLKRAEIRTHK